MEGKKLWYAVMIDNEDTDHDYGSFDLGKATVMAIDLRMSGYEGAYIAVIDTDDDFCVDEIREF